MPDLARVPGSRVDRAGIVRKGAKTVIRFVAATRTVLALVALLAGIPVLLVGIGGSPLPHHLPTVEQLQRWLDDPLRPTYVSGTTRTLAWLLWAAMVGLVVVAWWLRARRWQWSRLTAWLPGPVQGLAATLLGAATVTTTAAGVLPAHASGPAATSDTAHDPLPHSAAATKAPDGGTTAQVTARDGHGYGSRHTAGSVIVRPGDTLWDIADQQLGDPYRWKQIYRLNLDRYPHGQMRGGRHIEPGWKLLLPHAAPRPGKPAPDPPTTGNEPAQPSTPATPGPDNATHAPAPPLSASTNPQLSVNGDSDGVNETTSSAVPSASAPTTAGDTGRQTPPEPGRQPRTGVALASGSWLDLGLAAAIAAAVALVWAHRRRRYTRRPVSPELHLDHPDLHPMPPAVTEIRRRHAEPEQADTATGSRTHTFPSPRRTSSDDTESWHDDEPLEVDTEDEEPQDPDTDEVDQTEAPQQTRPVVPTLSNPATGEWPSSGLGLTGPGAEAAARGFLAAALADTDPGAPPGQVVLPCTVAATLLGAAAVTLPTTPRLIVTDDLGDALALLEQQILHRSRLVYAHEVDTVAAMRAVDAYEEPAPPILLIADAGSSHERTRINALLAQGQRLDIHGVLLGKWADGYTIIIDTDGTTTTDDQVGHGRHPADVGRLAVLTPTETVAVITTLAEAHTGHAQPIPPAQPRPTEPRPAPQPTAAQSTASDAADPLTVPDDAARTLAALGELGDATAAAIAAHVGVPYPTATAKLVAAEHAGHTETIRTDTGQTLWRLTDAGRTVTSTPTTPDEATTEQTEVEPAGTGTAADASNADVDTALRWPDPDTEFTSEPPEQPLVTATDDTAARGHIEVTVLGEPAIVATNPDRLPRKKALELLVYLAVHDGSATAEAILDDLLPDAPASKAPERLYTYVSDLRAVMRRTGGPATYLTHPHRRYVLNPDVIDIDLWRMRAALRDAAQAGDQPQRIAALRRAVDAYRGPLADGADYEWAEPYREAIRQQALDAHLALADALTDDPVARVQVLEAAIGHSPYSEHLYQEAMRARAALGHADAIRTLRRALDRALTEIDAEAGDDTITLAEHLIADLRQPGLRANIETTSALN